MNHDIMIVPASLVNQEIIDIAQEDVTAMKKSKTSSGQNLKQEVNGDEITQEDLAATPTKHENKDTEMNHDIMVVPASLVNQEIIDITQEDVTATSTSHEDTKNEEIITEIPLLPNSQDTEMNHDIMIVPASLVNQEIIDITQE